MELQSILCYLKQQIRLMVEGHNPETFRVWFGKSGPRDREILVLLALSTMRPEFPLRHRFSTPLEAVARLPGEERTRLCDEFRDCLAATIARAEPGSRIQSFCD